VYSRNEERVETVKVDSKPEPKKEEEDIDIDNI
jgi:hypothetical protein